MKPEKIIEVTDVELSTAVVTLKTVRVGKNKMTLAVFRQLPIKKEVPEKKDCWGVVRYRYEDAGPWILCVDKGILKKYRYGHCPWEGDDYEGWIVHTVTYSKRANEKSPYSYNPFRDWTDEDHKAEIEDRKRAAQHWFAQSILFDELPQLYIAV